MVASYRPEGELVWRTSQGELGPDEIICMHDFGYYNWIGTDAGFSGVIDWDMAGPGVPLDDIAFTAWNTAPLALPGDPAYQARTGEADGRGVRRRHHAAADPRRGAAAGHSGRPG